MREAWPEHRWIPVTEALPEKRRMVLMYYESGNMYTGCVVAVHGRFAVWHARNINAPGTTLVCDPDFWMPLPGPPENEGGKNND